MKIVKTTELTLPQKETILYLWNREYPQQFAITPEAFDVYIQIQIKNGATQHRFLFALESIQLISSSLH